MLHASRSSAFAFSWDELDELIRWRPGQRAMMASAAKFGLRQGFTVPANAAFEPSGSCSFATRRSGVIAGWRRDAASMGAFVEAALETDFGLKLSGGLRRTARTLSCSSSLALAVALAIPVDIALPAVAQAQEAQQIFNIPAGDLATALNALSSQTGVQLVYSAGIEAGAAVAA